MNCLIQHGDEWLRFSDPVEILMARTPDEVFHPPSPDGSGVTGCLQKIEEAVRERGLWAAGFIFYEAAGAFDSALKTYTPGDFPLLCFGLFRTAETVQLPKSEGVYRLGEWGPSVTRDEYSKAIAAIKDHIAAGDTYQVNYTFRLNADFEGDPFAFFCDLAAAQQGRYSAFIETDEFAICSASPELFFELKDGVITSRPMKGTKPRALTAKADRAIAEALQNSVKDRAENIMIVDMIRNDIGRIAAPGSVETVSRFDVEKYPTVWQMTSTVVGRFNHEGSKSSKEHQDASFSPPLGSLCLCGEKNSRLANVVKALFPCASITGAPKAKTMEIIRRLETAPRGVYTGSIGFIAPDGAAQFNVAIRTAVIQRGKAEYGIGGGIVWDSNSEEEYREALSKAAILTKKMPEFQLLETMLWEDGEVFLLERHLKRLVSSAEYFGYKIDATAVRDCLCNLKFDEPKRVRLLLNSAGEVNVESASSRWTQRHPAAAALSIAKNPVDSGDVFLYHKTTNRAVYEKAKADFPDADDVLLFNERGEVTESTIANVVVELDGRKVTPPVSCGLLAGSLRDSLLESGEISEQTVMLNDLRRASAIWLINSVRKWRKVSLNCSAS